MSFLSKAFHHIGHAISHGLHDLGHLAKSVVTLDLKGIKQSAHDLVHDAGELARGAFSLTPAGLAAQAILQGNYDKLMDQVEGMAEGVLDGVIDDVEKFGTGLHKTVDGLAHGRWKEIGEGLLSTTLGGASLALDFCPASSVESAVFKGVKSVALKEGLAEGTLQTAKQVVDTAKLSITPPPSLALPLDAQQFPTDTTALGALDPSLTMTPDLLSVCGDTDEDSSEESPYAV